MSKEKSSFVLYHDIREPLELLSDEQRGKLFMAILDYSEYGKQPDFCGDAVLFMAFTFIRGSLDRDAEAWESKRQKRIDAGRIGGQQTAANRANAVFATQDKQTAANQAVPAPVPVPASVPVPALVLSEKIKSKSEKKTLAQDKPARDTDFDLFWAAYPKKKAKGDAQKAFKKVKAPIGVILSAVEKQKQSEQWRRDGGRFIPYPATWLNGQRWEDETDAPTFSHDQHYIPSDADYLAWKESDSP